MLTKSTKSEKEDRTVVAGDQSDHIVQFSWDVRIAKAAFVYTYTFLQQPRSWAGAFERVGVVVCSYSLLTILL